VVRQAGGLHVIGPERHDRERVDNQLRGRPPAARGDPGSTRFFLSLKTTSCASSWGIGGRS